MTTPDPNFDGTPLVPGDPINGLRAFKIDGYGRFVGVTARDQVFKPGENVAHCRASYYNSSVGDITPQTHRAGTNGCSCGYWAYYTHGNPYYYPSSNSVLAVIQGYGLVTLGTRGFRAEKARLAAIVCPPPEASRELLDSVSIYQRAGVPIYDSLMSALADFPLTNPTRDGKNPEDEDGFWDKPQRLTDTDAWRAAYHSAQSRFAFQSQTLRQAQLPVSGGTAAFVGNVQNLGVHFWNGNTPRSCACPACASSLGNT